MELSFDALAPVSKWSARVHWMVAWSFGRFISPIDRRHRSHGCSHGLGRCPPAVQCTVLACLRDVDVHYDSLLQWRTFRSTFRSGRTCGVGRWIYYATIWCDRELSIIFAWTAWTWISVVSLFFGLRLKWMGLLWVELTNVLFITDYEIWGVIDEAQSLQFARLHNTMATFIVNCDLTLVCSDSFSFVSMSS